MVSRLMHKKQKAEARREAIVEAHKDDDIKECTFRPAIRKEAPKFIRVKPVS